MSPTESPTNYEKGLISPDGRADAVMRPAVEEEAPRSPADKGETLESPVEKGEAPERCTAEDTSPALQQFVIGDEPIDEDDIAKAVAFLHDVQPGVIYSTFIKTPMIYTIMEKPKWQEVVRPIVFKWIKNEANMARASRHVGRQLRGDRDDALVGYCGLRFKASKGTKWAKCPYSLGLARPYPQTVVFIALEDWSPENGFFTTLRKGMDICLDEYADIRWPPTGNGIGIFFALKL